jgi:hypothetical protein
MAKLYRTRNRIHTLLLNETATDCFCLLFSPVVQRAKLAILKHGKTSASSGVLTASGCDLDYAYEVRFLSSDLRS